MGARRGVGRAARVVAPLALLVLFLAVLVHARPQRVLRASPSSPAVWVTGQAAPSPGSSGGVATRSQPLAWDLRRAAEEIGARTTAPSTTTTTTAPATTSPTTAIATEAELATTAAPVATPPSTVAPPPPPIVARPVPAAAPAATPPGGPVPPWAAGTHEAGGHLVTAVGCASGTGAAALDAFLRERVGPVIGWDYQHVYPLGGDRYLWLFQDAFIDHSGNAVTLGQAGFAHNAALVQDGACFSLLHGGTAASPAPFEAGTTPTTPARWYWPMGGELAGGHLQVFWVEMVADAFTPAPGDGLGWHPERTWLATYDAATMARLGFRPASDPGVAPIFGYAVSSDGEYTYMFANTFEQNLGREGGFGNGPHSATAMWLARVPLGRLDSAPEYRSAEGWSGSRAEAVPILARYWAENPMQPRFIGGRWVAVTDVDGYWGDQLSIDVATDPWGPWTNVAVGAMGPRGGDPAMNAYHAHLAPWTGERGELIVTISNNARDMGRDAWPHPYRYRPGAFALNAVPAAAPPTTTTVPTTTTTVPESTSTTTTTTTTVPATTTTVAESTTTTTAVPESTTTTVPESTVTSVPGSTTTTMAGPGSAGVRRG